MDHDQIFENLLNDGYNFFTGVPDSGLKILQNKILNSDQTHVPAVNEAHALAIAFGAQLVGKKSCVYLQNSGLGNVVNPIASLCIPFGIEPLIIVGHRHSLPQHKIMGETDEQILKILGYKNYIVVHGDNNDK